MLQVHKPSSKSAGLDWPLMKNNITREDLDPVIEFLAKDDPILTQSANVRAFEREWSDWLGVKHSVFVNSGSSANLVTLAALKELHGGGEVIVPPLTWVSDIASVLQCGFTPVFVDVDPRTLGMDVDQILAKITSKTKAVFLTHILGYNALNQKLLDELKLRKIPLIEDVCESHGATFDGPAARLARLGVELLVLLRPPSEHHRRRHDLHGRCRTLRNRAHDAVAWHGARTRLAGQERGILG